jgi:hypothetical protein
MNARVSWLIFHIFSVAGGLYVLISIVNRPRTSSVFVIVLLAISLVLSLFGTWRIAPGVVRLARHPLQKKQQFTISGQPLEQFFIAPILVEGPCLLVLKSSLEMVAVAIGHTHGAQLSPFSTSAYSFVGVDFKIPPGKWPLKLVLQLPGHFFRSFRLGFQHEGKSFNATITLEARGRSSFIQLPETIAEVTRAFPVLEAAGPETHEL